MCRCASTANIWPGPMRPEGWMKLPSGDGGALYTAPGLPLGANDAPNRLAGCCHVITDTPPPALPATPPPNPPPRPPPAPSPPEATPPEPAAPPPPPVSIAVNFPSGTPSHCANND